MHILKHFIKGRINVIRMRVTCRSSNQSHGQNGIPTQVLKTQALKETSPKNTIPNGHET